MVKSLGNKLKSGCHCWYLTVTVATYCQPIAIATVETGKAYLRRAKSNNFAFASGYFTNNTEKDTIFEKGNRKFV